MNHDLLIRGGSVVDGTGAPARAADVAIQGDRIVAVGSELGGARETLDACGLVVSPGFIDPHTHYDAQWCWDPLLTSSAWHGVTSVVMGNCGVGIAPCRPAAREMAMMDLVNVEAMPAEVLRSGIRWQWETFPQFMDAVTGGGIGLNAGFLLPLAALRHYVMGEQSGERGANPAEIAQMADHLRAAMDAGALGFSTTVLAQHIGHGGKPLAARLASRDELKALCNVLRDLRRGTIQIAMGGVGGALSAEQQDLLHFLLDESRRPLTWTFLLVPVGNPERALQTLEETDWLTRMGAVPQVSCRPFLTQLEMTNPFIFADRKTFAPLFNTDNARLAAAYRDRHFRDTLRAELAQPGAFSSDWTRLELQQVNDPALGGLVGRTVADIAAERGADGLDTFLDIALEDGLGARFLYTISNIDLDVVARIINDPRTLIGASDGGAHVDQICDVGYATWLLGTWVRERKAMSLEYAVQRLTGDPARVFGIADRGRIAAGLKADIAVFDPATVGSDRLARAVFDLPGGRRRLVSDARGIAATVINGQLLMRAGDVSASRAGAHMQAA
ncbi:MAG: amidohydrolase family protein [Immundisolibacter sp.]|uniref:N-acyl-D-amino-acid deacylase family protein n=1 Tax=Immundisolibacter sp. TaxID=1934948 RepID=UPI0019B9B011|nr:amidohydrolase family protein [Immundisolibacter sp.]MBC7160888.1 amidohydrolase family protein [Immundisolibacter sp.]